MYKNLYLTMFYEQLLQELQICKHVQEEFKKCYIRDLFNITNITHTTRDANDMNAEISSHYNSYERVHQSNITSGAIKSTIKTKAL